MEGLRGNSGIEARFKPVFFEEQRNEVALGEVVILAGVLIVVRVGGVVLVAVLSGLAGGGSLIELIKATLEFGFDGGGDRGEEVAPGLGGGCGRRIPGSGDRLEETERALVELGMDASGLGKPVLGVEQAGKGGGPQAEGVEDSRLWSRSGARVPSMATVVLEPRR